MNANVILSLLILAYHTGGEDAVVRMITPPQSALAKIPGRQNPDLAEIQAQFGQAAKQIVQGIEAIYNKDFVDPDALLTAVGHLATVGA